MSDNLNPDEAIPPTPVVVPETLEQLENAAPMTEEQEIAFVSAARRSIIKQTMVNGKIPEDTEKQRLLLSALDGMDRSATARKRIKTEADSAKGNAAAAAATVAEFLNSLGGLERKTVPVDPSVSAPSLPASIAPPIRPEELVCGTHPVKAANFAENGTLEES